MPFFQEDPRIRFENNLGREMLRESARNDRVKDILQFVADVLNQRVLNPLIEAADEATSFQEITSQEYCAAITQLATMHSDQEKQYGGLLRDKYINGEAITSSKTNMVELLSTLKKTLTNIKATANTPDKIANVIKVIVDLGFSYVEKLPSLHAETFHRINEMLWLSPEEMNIRIMRKELGEPPKLATKLGIGIDDLKTVDEAMHGQYYIAGKSVYSGVDIEMRLALTAKAFDAVYVALQNAKISNDKPAIESTKKDYDSFIEKQRTNFGSQWVAALIEHQDFPGGVETAFLEMKTKGMFSQYAKKFEPSSIKLARNTGVSLVTTISGSTARALITLQDLDGFNTDGKFDLEKAQIVANCMMGFFICAGHHSLTEVAESYNRLIDYVVLEYPETLPSHLAKAIDNAKTHDARIGVVESCLPYYRIGDFGSFLSPSISLGLTKKCNGI